MIRVLVTAIGGGGHGEQILKALRLATPGRYQIFGADAKPLGAQSTGVDEFVTLPTAREDGYLQALLDACSRLEVDAVFHGCEPELLAFVANRDAITGAGVLLPINETSLIQLCMDKSLTNARLADLGVSSPRFFVAESENDIRAVDFFPVVAKPVLGGGGSANVYIAQDSHELLSLAAYLRLGSTGTRFLIQEYVGTPEQEFTVGILHDLDGKYVNSIAVRRHLDNALSVRTSVPNRTSRKDLGKHLVVSSGVSQGDIGRFPAVTEQCRDIAEQLGSQGPLNFQCRLVSGQVQIFEINPRFSGTTSLRAMAGMNEPDLLVRRHLLHHDIEPDEPYVEGTILRSLTESMHVHPGAGS